MDTKSQNLIIVTVAMLSLVALVGTIHLLSHRLGVPETLLLIPSHAVAGLCGALGPGLLQRLQSANPVSTTPTEPDHQEEVRT